MKIICYLQEHYNICVWFGSMESGLTCKVWMESNRANELVTLGLTTPIQVANEHSGDTLAEQFENSHQNI